ncbi:MAG: SMP-30/gluconolactonase/LRE family protein [Nocardioidaceae bacterium]
MNPAVSMVYSGMTSAFATGLVMGESPRWHGGAFWVCDWMAGEILRFAPDGERDVVHRVVGYPFSIDWLPDGRLLATSPRGVLIERGGELVPYGAHGQGWNEIVVDSSGQAFINEVGFDLMGGEEARAGTISVVLPGGATRTVAHDVWFPNGMAVSADGRTLICAESYAHCLTAFAIGPDGSLLDRRVWAQLDEDCYPDGICLDAEGAAWYADVPRRRCVRVAEGGAVLDVVEVDRGAFACMLGGGDGRTLFIAANRWGGVEGGAGEGTVLQARVAVPHAGRP